MICILSSRTDEAFSRRTNRLGWWLPRQGLRFLAFWPRWARPTAASRRGRPIRTDVDHRRTDHPGIVAWRTRPAEAVARLVVDGATDHAHSRCAGPDRAVGADAADGASPGAHRRGLRDQLPVAARPHRTGRGRSFAAGIPCDTGQAFLRAWVGRDLRHQPRDCLGDCRRDARRAFLDAAPHQARWARWEHGDRPSDSHWHPR